MPDAERGSMPAITHAYLTCTTPRSGSNFLCAVLRTCGLAGCPDDSFWNPPVWYERWQVSTFAAYLDRLLCKGTSPNGVFGCKMMWDYLGDLLPQLAGHADVSTATPHGIFAATFPHLQYVWLRKEDTVRQGISYYRALETGVWRSTDVGTHPHTEPPYSAQAIESLVHLCTWEDREWHDVFQRSGITPRVVSYEELVASPEAVAARILTSLGHPPPPLLRDRVWHHQRQADALTEVWAQRYRAAMTDDHQELSFRTPAYILPHLSLAAARWRSRRDRRRPPPLWPTVVGQAARQT
jgi:trehalose 2-sulfotransferase